MGDIAVAASCVEVTSVKPVKPEVAVIDGKWADQKSLKNVTADGHANILGGNEVYNIDATKLVIPNVMATDESLAYYNARLIKANEGFKFEFPEEALTNVKCTNASCICHTTKNWKAKDHKASGFPLLNMEVGKHYPEKYLKNKNTGGGCYLEYRDLPHFHMSRDKSAGGTLILGKFPKCKCPTCRGTGKRWSRRQSRFIQSQNKRSRRMSRNKHRSKRSPFGEGNRRKITPNSSFLGMFSKFANAPCRTCHGCKYDISSMEVTAFRIPFGCGIYTPANTIHCDAFLNGRLKVMYSNANHDETCILLKNGKDIVDVQVPNHCGIEGCGTLEHIRMMA